MPWFDVTDDYQQYLELAEREIRLGMADDGLLRRAVAQSGGVVAEAHQTYWRLRANQLQEQANATGNRDHIVALIASFDAQERRIRRRKERARWTWALVYICALLGVVLFPCFAVAAYRHGGNHFYALVFLSVASLGVSIVAFTACQFHTAVE